MREKWNLFFHRVRVLAAKDGVQLRRGLPAIVLLLVLLCAGCLSLCLSVLSGAKENAQKMAIAVVDKDNSMVSKMAIGMVVSNEEVAALFQVVNYSDDEQAGRAVYNGDAVAALIFEKGYMDKVSNGENSAVRIILSGTVSLHAQLIKEIAKTGEIFVKTGQYGVDAAWYPIMDAYENRNYALMRFDTFSTEFALKLLTLTDKGIAGKVLPYSTRAGSVEAHYILYYIVLLLSLMDMLFFDFVGKDNNRTFLCRLKSQGVSGRHILAAKLPFLFGAKTATLLLLLIALALLFGLEITLGSILSALCYAAFTAICGVGLCGWLQKSDVGPCLLCAISFGGLFLCGGLIPYDMLPEAVTALGIFTPVGAGAALLSPLFGGDTYFWHYLLAAVMAAAIWYAGRRTTDGLCVKGSERV